MRLNLVSRRQFASLPLFPLSISRNCVAKEHCKPSTFGVTEASCFLAFPFFVLVTAKIYCSAHVSVYAYATTAFLQWRQNTMPPLSKKCIHKMEPEYLRCRRRLKTCLYWSFVLLSGTRARATAIVCRRLCLHVVCPGRVVSARGLDDALQWR